MVQRRNLLAFNSVFKLTWRYGNTKSYEMSSGFVTTPIFYVNSGPHIGHVYSALLADAQVRFQKLRGKSNTFLSTGTDENGTKVLQASSSRSMTAQTFCDEISAQYKEIFKCVNIEADAFIRTTSKQHANAVAHFYKRLCSRNHIYSGLYEGWYCVSEEMFVPQVQVTEVKCSNSDKVKRVSSTSGQPVHWMKEKNYLFKLSSFQNDLLHWLKDDGVVIPRKFQEMLIKDVNEGLHDISVSRDRNRVPWGIPVPDDDTQTIYVWLDALVNYLTARNYPDIKKFDWPPDFHVIGKEILKFHGIYWPAFLIAAGMEPPRHLLVHSHWLVDHEKMSKSKGNVVDPLSRIQQYSSEGLRYYLLREGVPHSDCNYSENKVEKYLNAELANTLGNLLNRCTSKSLNPKRKFSLINPHEFHRHFSSDGQELVTQLRRVVDEVDHHYSQFNYYHGLEAIFSVLRQTNTFLQNQKPWEVKTDELRLDTIIGVVLEVLRVCGILLQPIIPTLSDNLLTRLGVGRHERQWNDAKNNFVSLDKDKLELKNQNTHERNLGNEKGVFFERVKPFVDNNKVKNELPRGKITHKKQVI